MTAARNGAVSASQPPDGTTRPTVLAGTPAWLRLWLAPVRGELETIAGTTGKPLGQLTTAEALSWAVVVSYGVLTGVIVGRLGANLALAALRGPVVVRR